MACPSLVRFCSEQMSVTCRLSTPFLTHCLFVLAFSLYFCRSKGSHSLTLDFFSVLYIILTCSFCTTSSATNCQRWCTNSYYASILLITCICYISFNSYFKTCTYDSNFRIHGNLWGHSFGLGQWRSLFFRGKPVWSSVITKWVIHLYFTSGIFSMIYVNL